MEDKNNLKSYLVSDFKENGIKNESFKVVPIQNILFDLGMKEKVKEYCDDRGKEMKIKVLKRDNLPLNKWEKVLFDIQNKKPLDPIKVKKYKDTVYYEIIDGRHRVVTSLFKNFTHVPIIII